MLLRRISKECVPILENSTIVVSKEESRSVLFPFYLTCEVGKTLLFLKDAPQSGKSRKQKSSSAKVLLLYSVTVVDRFVGGGSAGG